MKHALYVRTVDDLSDVRVLAALATAAEDAGYDGFFLYDSMLPAPGPDGTAPAVADTQVALTAVALATTRMRIGALVSPLPRRRPVKFAREVLSIDRVTGGRLVVGAGSGYAAETEFARLGEPAGARERADRLDEMLTVLDGLLRGREVSHDGEYLTVRDTQLADPLFQVPRVPFWIAADPSRPRTLRRAARWDGVFAMTADLSLMSLPEVARLRELLSTHRDPAAPAIDIVLASGYPDNRPEPTAQVVAEYERVGVTWWLEYALDAGQARALIERGAPCAPDLLRPAVDSG